MKEKKKIETKSFKSGMVTIVGRPNVGKSTLLNTILKEKVAIVSKIPQTTRNQIRGIYNDERGQIVFIDTPGIHLGRDHLDKMMNEAARMTLETADCIIYLIDLSRRIGKEELLVVDRLKNVKAAVIMGLNKIDSGQARVPEYIELWERAKGKPVTEQKNFTLLPMSGIRGTNIDKLFDVIFENLPEGPAYYPVDVKSDVPQRLAISDIIREKFFMLLRQELPHSIGVMVESMAHKGKVTNIKVLIFVEREQHKEIVIGKGGSLLKKVGTLARAELEHLLGTKVYLELRVKTQKNWRDDVSILTELGLQF